MQSLTFINHPQPTQLPVESRQACWPHPTSAEAPEDPFIPLRTSHCRLPSSHLHQNIFSRFLTGMSVPAWRDPLNTLDIFQTWHQKQMTLAQGNLSRQSWQWINQIQLPWLLWSFWGFPTHTVNPSVATNKNDSFGTHLSPSKSCYLYGLCEDYHNVNLIFGSTVFTTLLFDDDQSILQTWEALLLHCCVFITWRRG